MRIIFFIVVVFVDWQLWLHLLFHRHEVTITFWVICCFTNHIPPIGLTQAFSKGPCLMVSSENQDVDGWEFQFGMLCRKVFTGKIFGLFV